MTHSFQPIGEMNLQTAPIAWLWPPYLAAGKLTVLDGDPGSGKSMITIDLAARLSRAAPLPDGAAAAAPCKKTLLLNAEDDPADTLLPRLAAAGADLSFVFTPNFADGRETPRFPNDLPKFDAMVRELGIGLVVIDPLTGFVPPNLAEAGPSAVRRAVAPLALLAAHTGAAVLVVRHLTKKEGTSAIRRGLGSMSIAGLARTVLLVGRHPKDSTAGLLAVAKTNLSAAPDPLGFRLSSRDDSVVIDWLGPIAATADDACRHPQHREPPGIVRATLWLIDALAGGSRPAAELLAAAKADGISERSLERAKRSLHIESEFTRIPGQPRGWLWHPPEDYEGFLDPLQVELEPMECPIRQDLPKNMSKATQDILDRDRLAWACKNVKQKRR